MNEAEDLTKLIEKHSRRLQKLKEQVAVKGLNSEPELLIEIEDIEQTLTELQSNLGGREQFPVNQAMPDVIKQRWRYGWLTGLVAAFATIIGAIFFRENANQSEAAISPAAISTAISDDFGKTNTPLPPTFTSTPTDTPLPPTATPNNDLSPEHLENLPEGLRQLALDGADYIEIPVDIESLPAQSPVLAPSSPSTPSEGNQEISVEYIYLELVMRETQTSFVVIVPSLTRVGTAAEYLVRNLLPHLTLERYEWTLEFQGSELPTDHTLKTAGVRDGDVVTLVGNILEPIWTPSPPPDLEDFK